MLQKILYNKFYEPGIAAKLRVSSADRTVMAVQFPPLWIWIKNFENCDGFERTASDKLCAFFAECIRACGGKIDGAIMQGWAMDYFIQTLSKECRFSPKYLKWEMAALYLPCPVRHFPQGELVLLQASHIPMISEWMGHFHEQALNLTLSHTNKIKAATALIMTKKLYGLEIKGNIKAMGMIVPLMSQNMSKLNLIFTPYRNQGYGRDITAALSATIQAQGKMPVLYARVENIAAMNLYASLGFLEAGRLMEIRLE